MKVKPALCRVAYNSAILAFFCILSTTTTALAASVTFRWDPGGSNPDGYMIFARKSGQEYNFSQFVWQGSSTTCIVNNLQDQTEYFFVVRAFKGSIQSESSNEVHYIPPATQDDDDGMPDDWETHFGLNPLVDDADRDLDHDGISNRDEFRAGLEPDDRGVGAAPRRPELLFPESDAPVERNPLLDVGDFFDVDGDAHIATQWQVYDKASKNCLLDVVTNRWLKLLRVPFLLLNGDRSYNWRVRFFDSGGRASAWSARAYFTTQTTDGDLDGNGIVDDQEGGQVQAEVTRSFSSPTINYEPTHLIVASEETVAEIEQMALIDPNELEIDETTPARIPSAMLAYKLVLSRPGERALVTINLSDPAPAGATWIKYDSIDGWLDYSHHSAISADRQSVTVEVKDGDYGDADGVANGIIIDPAGLSTPAVSTSPTATGGGGGGGCFISTIHDAKNESPAGSGPWQWIKDSMIRLMWGEST